MSDLRTLAVQMYADQVTAANAIAQEVSASSGGVNRQIKDIRDDEETTDANILKYREARDALMQRAAEMREKIEAYIIERDGLAAMSDETRKEKQDEYKALRQSATAARKLLELQPGYDETWLADVPELLNFSTGKPAGQRASSGGSFRPRLASATVNGEDVSKDGKVTFTILAATLSTKDHKVGPRDLQEAALKEANAEDFSSVRDVDFVYSVNGENYEISIVLKVADEG